MGGPNFTDIRNDPSKIQLERLSHVIFSHEDLASFEKFAQEFGLVEAWRDNDTVLFRGYGVDQYCYVAHKTSKDVGVSFGGPAFIAQSQSDFDKAVALAGVEAKELSPWPGAGKIVTLKTPTNKLFHVVYGQEERSKGGDVPSTQVESKGPFNGSVKKDRYGEFQRFKPGPALVHKLGHLGYNMAKGWDEEMDWYTSNFNFVPSDIQYIPNKPEVNVIAFMHLDLGERFSDHHSLFLARTGPEEDHDYVHHTSFEVEDFDTQLLGHQWLAEKGYHALWGVGRHILGSQIFDYWRDTSGFNIEHYADGDLVNVKTPTKRTPAGPLAIWGPEIPHDFRADGTRSVHHSALA